MQIASLLLLLTTRMLGLFMLFPVLAIYAKNYHDYSPWLAGVAVGAYGLTQSILQIPYGRLSDRYGRKKLLLVGFSLFLFGSVIGIFANSVLELLVARIIQGCGAVSSVILALAIDILPKEKRVGVMTLFGIFIGGAFITALTLAPVVASGFGLAGIFMLVSALAAIGILLLLMFPTQPIHHANSSTSHHDSNALTIFCICLTSIFFLHLLLTMIFTLVPVRLLETYDIALKNHSLIYLTVLLISSVPIMAFIRSINSTAKWRRNIALSILVGAFSIPLLILNSLSLYVFLIGLFLYFVSFTVLEGLLPSLLGGVLQEKQRGRGLGYFASFQFIGAFCGGMLGGIANQFLTINQYIISFLAIIVVWVTLLVLLYKNTVFSQRCAGMLMFK